MIIRFVYSKTAMMKYLGHLDLLRFFERAFRRLKLPLAFSKGYNPHVKINFGGPLSVGVSSEYEVMDVTLEAEIDVEKLMREFNRFSPQGIKLLDYRITTKTESLMSALALSTYRVVLPQYYDLLARYQARDQIILKKKNKRKKIVEKDLKAFVLKFALDPNDQRGLTYQLAIKSSNEGSAKPLDIVSILLSEEQEFIKEDVEICRTGMFFLDEDGNYKPLLEL